MKNKKVSFLGWTSKKYITQLGGFLWIICSPILVLMISCEVKYVHMFSLIILRSWLMVSRPKKLAFKGGETRGSTRSFPLSPGRRRS